jgi:hypothetical protein
VVDMLNKAGWFDEKTPIPDFFVKMIVQRLRPEVFSPDDMIILAGEIGSAAYLIQSGLVIQQESNPQSPGPARAEPADLRGLALLNLAAGQDPAAQRHRPLPRVGRVRRRDRHDHLRAALLVRRGGDVRRGLLARARRLFGGLRGLPRDHREGAQSQAL